MKFKAYLRINKKGICLLTIILSYHAATHGTMLSNCFCQFTYTCSRAFLHVHSCVRSGQAPSIGSPVSFSMTPPPTHSDFPTTLTPSVFPTCDNVYAWSQSSRTTLNVLFVRSSFYFFLMPFGKVRRWFMRLGYQLSQIIIRLAHNRCWNDYLIPRTTLDIKWNNK